MIISVLYVAKPLNRTAVAQKILFSDNNLFGKTKQLNDFKIKEQVVCLCIYTMQFFIETHLTDKNLPPPLSPFTMTFRKKIYLRMENCYANIYPHFSVFYW